MGYLKILLKSFGKASLISMEKVRKIHCSHLGLNTQYLLYLVSQAWNQGSPSDVSLFRCSWLKNRITAYQFLLFLTPFHSHYHCRSSRLTQLLKLDLQLRSHEPKPFAFHKFPSELGRASLSARSSGSHSGGSGPSPARPSHLPFSHFVLATDTLLGLTLSLSYASLSTPAPSPTFLLPRRLFYFIWVRTHGWFIYFLRKIVFYRGESFRA